MNEHHLKKLSLDVSTFSVMIENNYLYIDKTKQIYEITEKGRLYFLSRPRRFGKSLLISTLKEFFLGNSNLFKDYWIGKSDYKWKRHPIIHLDFSMLNSETSQELKISLLENLNEIIEDNNLEISKSSNIATKLRLIIKKLYEYNPVVILIDEYDLHY